MKIGLVLEGGAMRALYTAGVLFGVNYLSKQKGRVIRYNKRFERIFINMIMFVDGLAITVMYNADGTPRLYNQNK